VGARRGTYTRRTSGERTLSPSPQTPPSSPGQPGSTAAPGPRTGLPQPLSVEAIDEVVLPALGEDTLEGGGRMPGEALAMGRDLTSLNAVPAGARARARLVSKASGTLAGLAVFARVFELCDPGARIELASSDGDTIAPGDELARIEGQARALLMAERTALNLIQRMSGIATLTALHVAACDGRARVLDTRKTTPNLRTLEKYAVRCGGGENHRFGLFDEVMIKDNHVDLAGRDLVEVVRSTREAVGPGVRITAEARDQQEALAGVAGGADVVMLDNMSVELMAELCPRLRRAAAEQGRTVELEASGGIDLGTIAGVAGSGVDRISVGALTHSAPALDLSLYLEPCR